MSSKVKTPEHIKLNERHHVERSAGKLRRSGEPRMFSRARKH